LIFLKNNYLSKIKRKELLIFMEFCGDQSTLDRISKETSGLPEKIVRGYTKSLLEAVATLRKYQLLFFTYKNKILIQLN